MDIIKLRNAVIAAIDESSIKPRTDDEYFCANVEYSKFEYHETLEVNFYTRNDEWTVFYTFSHDYSKENISVTRRYQEESESHEMTYSGALMELKNKFEEIGVNFDGKYI